MTNTGMGMRDTAGGRLASLTMVGQRNQRLLSFSVPQFPHLQYGDGHKIYITHGAIVGIK